MTALFCPLDDTYGLEGMQGAGTYRRRCPAPFPYSCGHAYLEYDAIARGATSDSVAMMLEEINEMLTVEIKVSRRIAECSRIVGRYRFIQDRLVGAVGLWDLLWAYRCVMRLADSSRDERTVRKARLSRTPDRFAGHNVARILGWILVTPRAPSSLVFTPVGSEPVGDDFFLRHTRRRDPREGMPPIGRAAIQSAIMEAVA